MIKKILYPILNSFFSLVDEEKSNKSQTSNLKISKIKGENRDRNKNKWND